MAYVYPNCITVVRWEGGRLHLNPGQQWNDDDPFVVARPEFFTADPEQVSTTTPAPRVERATQAPGERRVPSRRPAASKTKVTPAEEAKSGE